MNNNGILTLFESTASAYPSHLFAICEEDRMTYAECLQDARAIGYALSRLVARRHVPIMLFIEKSCPCLKGMLGILYSGNVYVPMDVKTPIDRLNLIAETLESHIVLTTREGAEHLDKIGFRGGQTYLIEDLIGEYSKQCNIDELDRIQDEMLDTDLMYILFTSGSTGIPKGVAVRYRSVLDYIKAYVRDVGISHSDVLGNQTPFYADMSLKDIYMSMAVGATICIIPQKYFMTPKKLLRYLDDNAVTSIAWVPTAYGIISRFDALRDLRPANIHICVFSGEAMPISVFSYWRERYPEATFIQQYGPTEITGACTSFHVMRQYGPTETIPIGRPFPNTGILLLDDEDQEIDKGSDQQGEICVYGTCLAAGYYNNQEKTAEAFVQNPTVRTHSEPMYRTGDLARWDEEGNLVFLSRKDYQIKHGGKRIELGEIENAVMAIEAVKSCCCVHAVQEDAIVLYYVGEADASEVRKGLMSKIPKYMVPTIYHQLDQLPQLPSGKLDRKKMSTWANTEEKEK